MDEAASPGATLREIGINGFWKKPPTGGVRRSHDPEKNNIKDDTVQFFKEERTDDAVYNIYLKKVQYHVDSDMCLDASDQRSARLQWRLEEVRVIRCGTLQRLVSALSSGAGEIESANVSVFLSTFRTFATAKDVVDELLKRYKQIGEEVSMKQHVREAHRRAVKTVLCVWLESYPDDFHDPPSHSVLRSLQKFGEQQMQDGEFCQKTSKILKAFSQRDDLSGSSSPRNQNLSFIFSNRTSQDLNANYFVQRPEFTSIPSQTFAEQLTYVDAELFKKVVPHHCLGSVWSQRSHKYSGSTQSPSVYATVEQFNAVTYRVIATVVKQPMLPANERALIVQKWIDIAQECRHLKNFSSLKAIVSGLQSAPVYRLQSVWSLVPRQKLTLFAELSAIFSEENNQRVCRELLNKEGTAKCADPYLTKTPKRLLAWPGTVRHRRSPLPDAAGVTKAQGTVPYLGTFLTDLMMLDAALKDTLEGKLINFEKRRKEFEILMQIKLLQSAACLYQIEVDELFMKWFFNIRVYDDSESFELSLEIEPEPSVSTPSTPLVKGHQKNSSLGYFTPRNLSVASSMDDILDTPDSGGSISLRRHRRKGSDTSSGISIDVNCRQSNRLSHSASVGSLHSLSPELIPSPFRSEDSIVVKVYMESEETHATNHYKSIVLRNSDHTKTLLLNAFLKYNITAKPEEYTVSQILSNKTELRLPEKGNIFYAINTSEPEIQCVIRRNSAPYEARTRPATKLHWRKLHL